MSIDNISYANYWNAIDSNLDGANCIPEYCNTCDTTNLLGVPKGFDYYHYSRSGKGMAHARLYFDNSYVFSGQRDYMQGRFFANLISGKNYCVTIYVTLTQMSQYAINKIGAYIDDGSIDIGQDSNGCALPQTAFTPQIVTDSIINDTMNWVKIHGNYIATGNERFITIGNFTDILHIDTIKRGGLIYCDVCAFYLIDDVSVIASDAVATAGIDQWVSPGSDSVFIGIPDEGMPTTWYIAGNPIPQCHGAGGMKVHPDTTTKYVVVLDLCGHITTDTVIVNVARAGVPIMLNYENVKVYPNPATNALNIEGVGNSEVGVYNMMGREKWKSKSGVCIDVSGWVNGVYCVVVVDGETGERVVKRVVKE